MIEGRKPNGYLTIGSDGFSPKRELETRMCVHCQYTWQYDPHLEARARNTRGFCLRCYGFTCERPECHAEQKRLLAELPNDPRPCISFWEAYQRRLQKIANHPLWEVTPSGMILPKSDLPDNFAEIGGLWRL